MKRMSGGEQSIFYLLKSMGEIFEREYMGIPGRKFKFDFAIPEKKIAIEYEGGTWSGGAHVRGAHYSSDCEKYSLAAIHGWCVIRITADMLQTGKGQALIKTAAAGPGAGGNTEFN